MNVNMESNIRSIKDLSGKPPSGTGNREARPKSSIQKSWLAATVRLFHEKKVGERLTAAGIENYLPVQKEYHKWSDRMKQVEKVVIPMVIFVHVTREEQLRVLSQTSVIRYYSLCGEHRPAVIPDAQMDKFRFMMENSEHEVQITSDRVVVGGKVKVVKGPLCGLEGEVVNVNSDKKVGIYLNSIGYAYIDVPMDSLVQL